MLVDAPPLLGIADTQALARCADSLLYVARLDRITVDNVMDARDMLDRLDVEPDRRARHRRAQRGVALLRRAARAGARGRLSGRGARQHRARPDQSGEDPQVTPVQRVDEDAVRQQPAPGGEQARSS